MAATNSSIITCYILNLLICLGCFLAFSFLRLTNHFKRFFAPRRFAKDIQLRPRRLPAKGVFSWIAPLLRYKEGEIIDEVGLDAAMYLRIFTFGLQLFAGLSIWCLIAVLPVNVTGGEIENLKRNAANPEDVTYISFDRCSLTNVSGGSMRMWVHLASVYFVTLFTLWLLWRFNQASVKLRVMFLARSRPGGPTHTILVTDIPGIDAVSPGNKKLNGVMDKIKKAAGKDKNSNDGGDEEEGRSKPSPVVVDPLAEPTIAGVNDLDSAGVRGRPLRDSAAYQQPQQYMPPTSTPSGADAYSAQMQPLYRMDEDEQMGQDGPAVRRLSAAVRRYPAGPVAEGVEQDDALGKPNITDNQMSPIGAAANKGDGTRRRRTYDPQELWLDAKANAASRLDHGLNPKEMVEAEFRDVYPANAVVAVNMVNDQSNLDPLVEEFDEVTQKLDDYLDECNFRMGQGQYVERKKVLVLGSQGEWGKARGMGLWNKVDAIDYWTARLTELSRLINLKQDRSSTRYTSSAFVTFSSRSCQSTAASALHYHDETVWRTQNAPEPFELVWKNLAMKLPQRTTRSLLMWTAFVLMTLFFMIPVGAIQAIINIDNLSKNATVAKIVNAPVLKQLLQAIIPGLALVVFLAFVPAILAFFMKTAGAISQSEIDFGVVVRYYAFQVVVVFFYNVIGGSLVASLQQWINSPTSAVTILGTSIPVVSTFFITYIMIKGVGTASIGLLRVVPLVMSWLLIKMAGSPKAQYRIWSEQYTKYGNSVAPHTIVMLLGIVYSLINPIITPTVLFYFLINMVIQRYQTIYVYRKHYESGGRMWRLVFHQIMFALYLFQVCMLGLLGIKKFPYTPIIIPAIIATGFFHYTCISLFKRPWTLAAQHDAADLDRREATLAIQPGMGGDHHALTPTNAGGKQLRLDHPVDEWVDRCDIVDSTDPEMEDGPEPEQEPVEIAYLSRAFKLRVPDDVEGLLRDADTVVGRIEGQGPKPTKKELKDKQKADKAELKRQRAELKDIKGSSNLVARDQNRFHEVSAV